MDITCSMMYDYCNTYIHVTVNNPKHEKTITEDKVLPNIVQPI